MTKTVYDECDRYLNNASDILKKNAGLKDGEFLDTKYVAMAGGIAYKGVLLALDEYLKRKEGLKYVKPKSIEEYRTRLAKQNKSLLKLTNEVYAGLHLSMYYHAVPSINVWKKNKEIAKEILNYIK